MKNKTIKALSQASLKGTGLSYMADSTNYKNWYLKAQKDLKDAKNLFKYDEADEIKGESVDFSSSAFHCQQSIEKCLKGYILKETQELFEGHNLKLLCKEAGKIDPFFRNFDEDCRYVNDYYTEPRYPDDDDEFLFIRKDEAETCIKIAEKITEYTFEADVNGGDIMKEKGGDIMQEKGG